MKLFRVIKLVKGVKVARYLVVAHTNQHACELAQGNDKDGVFQTIDWWDIDAAAVLETQVLSNDAEEYGGKSDKN